MMNDMIEIHLARNTRTPPAEFMIWAYGTVRTSKYPDASLTSESAAACVAEAEKHGIEMSIDYEHAAVGPADGQPKPAAAWFTLEARADGLWATNVRWTARASQMLSAGEYRHFSPVYSLNAEKQISRVVNLALTNLPATRQQAPLVAAKGIVAAAPSDQASVLVSCIASLLDVSGTGSLLEAQAWLEAARVEKAEAADKQAERAIAAALFEGKIASHQRETYVSLAKTIGPDALEKAFSAMEVRDTAVTVTKILDRASESGKIPPSMRASWLSAGRAIGPEMLTQLVASMGVLAGTKEDADAIKGPDTSAVAVSAELKRALEQLGLTEEDHKAAVRDQARERAAEEAGAF